MTLQSTPSGRAGGTIRPSRFVKASGSEDNTLLECDAGELAVGVSTAANLEFDSDNHATDGIPVYLQAGDVVMVEAGAAVVRGVQLSADADGRAVTFTNTAGKFIAGVALQSASAAGEIIQIWRYTSYIT